MNASIREGASTDAATRAAPRRRLAPNVVCLHMEDREPVVNARRRGRYPRGVVSIKSRPRLMPGDVCEMIGGLPSNRGKLVRILELCGWLEGFPRGDWIEVRAVYGDLDTFNIENGEGAGSSSTAVARAENLRRVHRLAW